MANGQQKAEENLMLFNGWAASRTDDDLRSIVVRDKLSRTTIADECGFARSVLTQNPRVHLALSRLEERLRAAGVLAPLAAEPADDAVPLGSPGRTEEAPSLEAPGRQRRLETENALLRAENTALKQALSKHAILSEALSQSGRLPR